MVGRFCAQAVEIVDASPHGSKMFPDGFQFSMRDPQIVKNRQKSTNSTRYMLPKSRGVFFLRSPKRRRQPPHRRTLLGDPETGKKGKFPPIYDNFYQYITNIFDFFKNVDFSKCRN